MKFISKSWKMCKFSTFQLLKISKFQNFKMSIFKTSKFQNSHDRRVKHGEATKFAFVGVNVFFVFVARPIRTRLLTGQSKSVWRQSGKPNLAI